MKSNVTKILIICVIGVTLALIWSTGVTRYLSFSYLKAEQEALVGVIEQKPFVSAALFFLAYVVATALSIPGAAVLTIAAGALFGFLEGTILVSFASTIGATLAFLASRYLFRDWVRAKFSQKLKKIDAGIEREGGFYLFALRLVPVFPFFVINLVMGLTKMKVGTFFVVSQVGMLAGTMAYVNAGTQLSRVESMSGILSWPVLLSFALLGLLPLIAKRIVEILRTRKVLKPYSKPDSFDYNVVAIGAGAAGLVTSYIAAALKAKVALIERHRMGGDCLNTGCVPSKALIRSAKAVHQARNSSKYGIRQMEVDFDFAEVMERVQSVIQKIEPHDSVERYTRLGVDCIEGQAKILSPYEIEVNGAVITTRNIVITTGARPLVPDIPGLDAVNYYTSDTIWNLRKLPERLIVLGGGPVGSELTQCFHRLGSQVTQIEAGDCILSKEDQDASDVICKRFMDEGIRVLINHRAKRIEVEGDTKFVVCQSRDTEIRLEFDELLLALGRKSNVSGFGLEELGVKLSERGTIDADDLMRTNFPNIYAAGDVAGPYQFTHVAAHQAWYASVNALLSPFKAFKADYRVIPWCTFTDPEVARVGINEKEAKEQGIEYRVFTYHLSELDRAIADSADSGFVKVLTPGKGDKILGATIVGEHAGELLVEFVLAMKYNLGLNKILGTIHVYPTHSEANKYVAGEWKRTTAPEKLLALAGRFHRWRRGKNGKRYAEADKR